MTDTEFREKLLARLGGIQFQLVCIIIQLLLIFLVLRGSA